MSSNKLSVICPTVNHNGESLMPIIKEIAKELAMMTGGVSEQGSHGGIWYDVAGKEYAELSVILWTVCDDELLCQIKERFEEWRVSLQQISLLVIVETVDAIFVEHQGQEIEAA